MIVPFMACGDLSAFDSDQTYQLTTEQYQSLSPTQEPINPPYKTACLLKKTNSLATQNSADMADTADTCS